MFAGAWRLIALLSFVTLLSVCRGELDRLLEITTPSDVTLTSEELQLIPKSPGRPPVEPEPSMEAEEEQFSLNDSDDPAQVTDNGEDILSSPEPENHAAEEKERRSQMVSVLESVFGVALDQKGTDGAKPLQTAEFQSESSDGEALENVLGPMPMEESTEVSGDEELDMESSPEASIAPENGISKDDENPEPSMEPIQPEPSSEYVEPSAEYEPYPSDEAEDSTLTLLVQHPIQLTPEVIASRIRNIADEFLPKGAKWVVESIVPLSRFSKMLSSRTSADELDDDKTMFELGLYTKCVPEDFDNCVEEKRGLVQFVRDEKMDENLAAHDLNHVYVYVKGDDIVDRAGTYQASTASGMSAGVIAGIAVGGVATVSLIVLGVMFFARRSSGSSNYDAELGYMGDFDDDERPSQPSSQFSPEDGSFLISNFGGTPRNTSGMIPWMNVSHGRQERANLNSSSFISVETLGESPTQRMSQYRFEDTTSTSSGSDLDDLQVASVPEAPEPRTASDSSREQL